MAAGGGCARGCACALAVAIALAALAPTSADGGPAPAWTQSEEASKQFIQQALASGPGRQGWGCMSDGRLAWQTTA